MKLSLSIGLLVFGAIFAGLGLAVQQTVPEIGQTTLLTGVIGGALSLLWGFLGLRGMRTQGWAILSLGGMAFVMLSQSVTTWMGENRELAGGTLAAGLMTLMLILAVGIMAALAYSLQFESENNSLKQNPS